MILSNRTRSSEICLRMISQKCNRRSGSSCRRPCNSLGRCGFKLSLVIKRRNYVLEKESSLAAGRVDFFVLLTNVSHLIFLCHRRPRTSTFWCISHWTHCMKIVSDAINCQACWWGSIKRFYPCCRYPLGIFSFPIMLLFFVLYLSSLQSFTIPVKKKIITLYLILAHPVYIHINKGT